MPPSIPRQPELIVALDYANARALHAGLSALPASVTFGKVGLELFTAEGAAALQPLADRHMRLFLDLKFHDIPHTVAQAVKSAARLGATPEAEARPERLQEGDRSDGRGGHGMKDGMLTLRHEGVNR